VRREWSVKVKRVDINYDEWVKTVSKAITGDSLWKVEVYRLALFAADIGWHDVSRLMRDKRTLDLSDRLCRDLDSIGANVSEGYSRGTGKDRARFYEYGLGSARKPRLVLERPSYPRGNSRYPPSALDGPDHPFASDEDPGPTRLREESLAYGPSPGGAFADPSWADPAALSQLLQTVPLP